MRSLSLSLCSLTVLSVSDASLTFVTLGVTDDGLEVPSSYIRGDICRYMIDTNSSSTYLTPVVGSDVEEMPVLRFDNVAFHATEVQHSLEHPSYVVPPSGLGLGIQSDIARRFKSVTLVPWRNKLEHYFIMGSYRDGHFCIDNQMVFIDMIENALALKVQVSLIPNPSRRLGESIESDFIPRFGVPMEGASAPARPFYFKSMSTKNRIPRALYEMLETELRGINGQPARWYESGLDIVSPYHLLMPTIRFSFYNGDDIAAIVEMSPEMYISVERGFGKVMFDEYREYVDDDDDEEGVLGVNFLRNFVIQFDYERNRVGLCYPK